MIAHCQVRNKKIIADSGILVLDALFSTLFTVLVCLQQRKTAVLSLLFPYGLVPILDALALQITKGHPWEPGLFEYFLV